MADIPNETPMSKLKPIDDIDERIEEVIREMLRKLREGPPDTVHPAHRRSYKLTAFHLLNLALAESGRSSEEQLAVIESLTAMQN